MAARSKVLGGLGRLGRLGTGYRQWRKQQEDQKTLTSNPGGAFRFSIGGPFQFTSLYRGCGIDPLHSCMLPARVQ